MAAQMTRDVADSSDESLSESEEESTTKKSAVFLTYIPTQGVGGQPHPAPVCESASLAYVHSPKLELKLDLTEQALLNLSELQIETATLACQKHEIILNSGLRAGFFIGDGTGVGKGRTLAAIIMHNYSQGRHKALFVTASKLLWRAMDNDLRSIGYTAKVITLDSYDAIENQRGVICVTYSTLYSSSKKGLTRYKQIVHWLGQGFEGPILFDESHRAKKYTKDSTTSTIMGTKVVQLQLDFPRARVVYSSATGAWEPSHMTYMQRLGLWGSSELPTSNTFVESMEKRGVEAMELLALELKQEGFFVARQLSFAGVSYEIYTVPFTDEFKELYDESAYLWCKMIQYLTSKNMGGKTSSKFWACHQRFFASLCMSAKVDYVVLRSRMAVEGSSPFSDCDKELPMSVIVGLQTTGQASFMRERVNKKDKVFETPYSLLRSTLTHCITRILGIKFKSRHRSSLESDILQIFAKISNCFGRNPLDQIISDLGGVENVAELTGRANREVPVLDDTTIIGYKSEARHWTENDKEHELFMHAAKNVVIISDAASTGISLHSAKSFNVNRKRLHITIELPWSADKTLQQFGRSHRSNQFSPPHYLLVMSSVPAERRVTFAVAERLQQMGALTHGDRRASDNSALSEFSINRATSKLAIQNLLQGLTGKAQPVVDIFCTDLKKEEKSRITRKLTGAGMLMWKRLKPGKIAKHEKTKTSHKKRPAKEKVISRDGRKYLVPNSQCYETEKFLNRLYSIDLTNQNSIWDLYQTNLEYFSQIQEVNREVSGGIKDISPPEGSSCKLTVKSFTTFTLSTGLVELKELLLDSGMEWKNAVAIAKEAGKGNWTFAQTRSLRPRVLLAVRDENDESQFQVFRPSVGRESETLPKRLILKNRDQISTEAAQLLWKSEYQRMANKKCWHEFISPVKKCEREKCSAGARFKTTYVISGCLTKIWSRIRRATSYSKLTLLRCTLSNGRRAIGLQVNPEHVDRVTETLDELINREGAFSEDEVDDSENDFCED